MFASMRRLLVAAAVLALLQLGCGVTETTVAGGLPDHDPELAYRLVNQEHALLLDVRTSREYLAGHVPGAKNIDVQELPDRLNEVEALVGGKKDRPIVVYCTRGVRAAQAKRILLKAGYEKVTNLGGLYDWPSK
jgi:rhodanese-related sulfurtransferase